MAAPIAADWSNFLVAEAGASAALAGLLFVAVSINIAKIIEYPGVSGARRGSARLIDRPADHRDARSGAQPIANNSRRGIPGGGNYVMDVHGGSARAPTAPGWAPLVVAGVTSRAMPADDAVLLYRGCSADSWPSGRNELADPGCVFAFLSSTTSAWVLLIEINR